MLIFLDIDGVMVPANPWKRPEFHVDGFPMFSFQATNALNKILLETDAKIVLTSSHKSIYSPQEWMRIFASRGITLNTIQPLPENIPFVNRREELLRWFKMHHPEDNFVIIDDDKSLNDLPYFLKSRLLLTNGAIGLTLEQANEAIRLLSSDNPVVYA